MQITKHMFFLVTKERRRNYLVSEPNYHAAKFFKENLLVIEKGSNNYGLFIQDYQY